MSVYKRVRHRTAIKNKKTFRSSKISFTIDIHLGDVNNIKHESEREKLRVCEVRSYSAFSSSRMHLPHYRIKKRYILLAISCSLTRAVSKKRGISTVRNRI